MKSNQFKVLNTKISCTLELGIVVPIYLSTWEVETRGSEMEKRGHLHQHTEFEVSVGYMKLSPKKGNSRREEGLKCNQLQPGYFHAV